jgi:hypothetical protein
MMNNDLEIYVRAKAAGDDESQLYCTMPDIAVWNNLLDVLAALPQVCAAVY